MARPIPFSELFADPPRCSDPIECGHEAALGQSQEEVKRLREAMKYLIPAAHDLDSTKCRERAARQEKLSPCQQSVGEWDDECPACEALALLTPEVRRG